MALLRGGWRRAAWLVLVPRVCEMAAIWLAPNGTDGVGCGKSEAVGCATLECALANASESGDEIWFTRSARFRGQGYWRVSIPPTKDLRVYGQNATIDLEYVAPALEIVDIATRFEVYDLVFEHGGGVALEGGGAVRIRSSSTKSANSTAVHFERCTFRENVVPGATSASRGGALYVENAHPSFRDCVFEKNSAGIAGAAVIYGDSSPYFERCVFRENTLHASLFGGAVVVEDSARPVFDECYWVDNGGVDVGYGGAVDDGGTSSAVFRRNVFNRSTARLGGTYYAFSQSTAVFQDCLFVDGLAMSHGGFVYASSLSSPTFLNCTFRRATCYGDGGALSFRESSAAILSDVFIENALATSHGAGLEVNSDRPFVVHNVTIRNCVSGANGGGLSLTNYDSTVLAGLTVENCASTLGGGGGASVGGSDVYCQECVFRQCDAPDAGAVYVNFNFYGQLTFVESLFYGNVAAEYGGALAFSATGATQTGTAKVVVRNSTFEANRATYGGALAFSATDQAIGLATTLFSKNTVTDVAGSGAIAYGGALYVRVDETTSSLFEAQQQKDCAAFINATVLPGTSELRFIDNSADAGGVLYLDVADVVAFAELGCDDDLLAAASSVVRGNTASSYGPFAATSVASFNVSSLPTVAAYDTFDMEARFFDLFGNFLGRRHERVEFVARSTTPSVELRQLNSDASKELSTIAESGVATLNDLYLIGALGANYTVECSASIDDSRVEILHSTLGRLCPAGYLLDVGQDVCIECAAGSAKSTRDASTTCESCAPGKFAATTGSTSCDECPRGKATAAEGSTSCSICSLDEYAEFPGMTSCSACPANSERVIDLASSVTESALLGTNVTQCLCKSGYFSSQPNSSHTNGLILRRDGRDDNWGLPGVSCDECPTGGSCDGKKAAPRNSKDYWGDPKHPTRFVKCKPQHCKKDYQCHAAFRPKSHLCSQFRSNGEHFVVADVIDFRCPSNAWAAHALMMALILGIGSLWLWINFRPGAAGPSLDVFLRHIQQIAILLHSYKVAFPTSPLVDALKLGTKIALFDVDVVLPLCSYHVSELYVWYVQWSIIVLGASIAFSGVVADVAKKMAVDRRYRASLGSILASLNMASPSSAFGSRVAEALGLTLAILDKVYATLTGLSVGLMPCVALPDGRRYLTAHPDKRCSAESTTGVLMRSISSLTLVVVVVGMPHVVALGIWQQFHLRGGLHYSHAMRLFGWSCEPFRPPLQLWGIVFYYRAALVVCIATFMQDASMQLFLTELVVFTSAVLHFAHKPIRSTELDRLESWGLALEAVFVGAAGLLIDEKKRWHREWTVIIMVSVFSYSALALWQCLTDVGRDRIRRTATDRLSEDILGVSSLSKLAGMFDDVTELTSWVDHLAALDEDGLEKVRRNEEVVAKLLPFLKVNSPLSLHNIDKRATFWRLAARIDGMVTFCANLPEHNRRQLFGILARLERHSLTPRPTRRALDNIVADAYRAPLLFFMLSRPGYGEGVARLLEQIRRGIDERRPSTAMRFAYGSSSYDWRPECVAAAYRAYLKPREHSRRRSTLQRLVALNNGGTLSNETDATAMMIEDLEDLAFKKPISARVGPMAALESSKTAQEVKEPDSVGDGPLALDDLDDDTASAWAECVVADDDDGLIVAGDDPENQNAGTWIGGCLAV